MSMVMTLWAVSDTTIDRLQKDDGSVLLLVFPDDPDVYREQLELDDDAELPSLELGPAEGREFELDKAWDGLGYLLGHADDDEGERVGLLDLQRIEESAGDTDVGYGPAAVIRAATMAEHAQALQRCTDARLNARFDGSDMMKREVYPAIWDRDPDEDDTRGWLMAYLPGLRKFCEHCREHSLGCVIAVQ